MYILYLRCCLATLLDAVWSGGFPQEVTHWARKNRTSSDAMAQTIQSCRPALSSRPPGLITQNSSFRTPIALMSKWPPPHLEMSAVLLSPRSVTIFNLPWAVLSVRQGQKLRQMAVLDVATGGIFTGLSHCCPTVLESGPLRVYSVYTVNIEITV